MPTYLDQYSNLPTKVLILYNRLFHYRIPIFKLLAEKVELTVAYSLGESVKENVNFKLIKLPIIQFKNIVYHKSNIHKISLDYDVIIVYGDIKWLKFSILPFVKKDHFKVIYWTIGTSTSMGLDKNKRLDKIRHFIYKKADALIFYSDYPINKYLENGYSREKLFIANNTVQVENSTIRMNKEEKNNILFIGSLNKRKGIFLLLEAYKSAYIINKNLPHLDIVGGGEEFDNIKKWIIENNLSNKIFLQGAIYEIEEKVIFFQKAIACISPKQAGLSVLESMGYGVPFITFSDAITGGEIFNITNNYNGLILDPDENLSNILIDISNNKDKYMEMGQNALNFYNNNRKPEHVVDIIIKAIEYVNLKCK